MASGYEAGNQDGAAAAASHCCARRGRAWPKESRQEMTLCVNQVIEWIGAEDASSASTRERILWIDAAASQVVTIGLTDQRVLPRLRQYEEIVLALETGVARAAIVDPSAGRLRTEQEI